MLSLMFAHCGVDYHYLSFIILFVYSSATTAPPTTTSGFIPTYAPDRLLYERTTDYHWPLFSENATKTDGEYSALPDGLSDGPFGFGKSIKLKEDQVST